MVYFHIPMEVCYTLFWRMLPSRIPKPPICSKMHLWLTYSCSVSIHLGNKLGHYLFWVFSFFFKRDVQESHTSLWTNQSTPGYFLGNAQKPAGTTVFSPCLSWLSSSPNFSSSPGMVDLWKPLSGLESKMLGRLHELQSHHVGLCPGYDGFLIKRNTYLSKLLNS